MIFQTTHPLPTVEDKELLPASLKKIADALEQQRELNPSQMRDLVISAGVIAEDIAPWADFDHPVQDSYGRRLIYKGAHFEIMAMSWNPGDISAIHDHGHTEWGAVQVFGPAEHATFAVRDNQLYTSARFLFNIGDVVGVSHELIHQMGNSTDNRFMTLHVYGQPENIESVTGDARVYDLKEHVIQRVDGGVFFSLPKEEVKRTEACTKADFPTRLRHLVELARRLKLMNDASLAESTSLLNDAVEALFHPSQSLTFRECIKKYESATDLKSSEQYFNILKWEVSEAAKLEKVIQGRLPEAHFSYIKLANQLNNTKSFEKLLNVKASLN